MSFGRVVQHLGRGAGSPLRVQTITIEANSTVGNTAILTTAVSNSYLISSVVDSKGNRWSIAIQRQNENGLAIAYCVIETALLIGDTVTVTYSGNGYGSSGVNEIEGSAVLDRTASSSGTASLAADSGTTDITTDDIEFCIAAFAVSGLRTLTPTNGYTLLTRPPGSATFVRVIDTAYLLTSRRGAQQFTGTFASTSNWPSAIATFKSASAPPPAAGRMLAMVI